MNLRPSDVHLGDVAHALAHLARFNGHARRFYSVAQHSVLVSVLVDDDLAAAALLHDAGEAYVGDLTSPLRAGLRVWAGRSANSYSAFDYAEERARDAVLAACGVPDPGEDGWRAIKRADLVALATERRDVLAHPGDSPWSSLFGVDPAPGRMRALEPMAARRLFFERARELKRRRHRWRNVTA